MYLALIETAGNQAFIFGTNRLAENIGASELTYQAGTRYVLEALAAAQPACPTLWATEPSRLRANLDDRGCNARIEDGAPHEVMVATSGKALVLFREWADAEALIRAVTLRALREAPGLTVGGVISRGFDFRRDTLDAVVREAHARYEAARGNWAGPQARFPRLPVVRDCAGSAYPAERLQRVGDGREAWSAVTSAKRAAAAAQIARVRRQFPEGRLLRDVADMEAHLESAERDRWVGVVHADGNGFGSMLLRFGDLAASCGFTGNRAFIHAYRRFSLALDACTERAFAAAMARLPRKDGKPGTDGEGPASRPKYPLVPLVLGGDDLTVLCPGGDALQFAHDYLEAFERESGMDGAAHFDGIVGRIARAATGSGRMSACAGVAVVKAHYPFHAAYDLAESLLRVAKQVKARGRADHGGSAAGGGPCSALDFHVLYDTSLGELGHIRQGLTVDDGRTRLYARPVVVSDLAALGALPAADRAWLEARHWRHLRQAVKVIQARHAADGGRPGLGPRRLPSGPLHDLRSGLFLGREAANGRLRLIYQRYRAQGIDALLGTPEPPASLFWPEDGDTMATRFLDAMDAAAVFTLDGEDGQRERVG